MRSVGKTLLLLLLLMVSLAGCTTRRATVAFSGEGLLPSEVLLSSPSVSTYRQFLSGNVRITADADGDSHSLRGTIRIKSNDGVQIGITALNLAELACAEFFPETVRFIHKPDKVYADVPFSSLSFLNETGVDYRILESVLMNRLFTPDGTSVKKALKEMDVIEEGEYVVASFPETKGVSYSFFVEKQTGNLVRTEGTHRDGVKVVCSYSGFKELGGVSFPHIITIELLRGSSAAKLKFKFTSANGDSFKLTPRRVPGSYVRLDAETLLNSIGDIQ